MDQEGRHDCAPPVVPSDAGAHTSGACGFPWASTERPCEVGYTKGMCPKTQGWLSRAVVLPINQNFSEEFVDQVDRAIRKVAQAWE